MSITVQHRRDTRAVLEAVTPAEGELGYDKTLATARMGDGATLGGHLLKKWGKSYILVPAQITANQNDYNPTDLSIAEILYLDLDADRSLTGIAGGSTNRELSIFNGSAFRLTLVDASASSTAGNRFSIGSDFVLRSGQGVRLIYVAALSRWQIIGRADLGITTLPEDFALTGDITPTQITADQNNYNPTGLSTASRLRLSSDASRNITGLTGGADGRVMMIVNTGSNAIVLKDGSASSTAANRFDFGADVTLASKNAAIIQYDTTDSRWKLLAATAGAAVADGAVTAPKLSAAAAGGHIINGKLVYSVAGSALTIAVKNLAGNDPSAADPVWMRVRDTTASTDAADWMKLTAALSLVVSSGSSMGAASATAFRLWTVLFNDGGTPRLGIINCLSGTDIYPLAAWPIASSTAEGGAGAADSAHTFYTDTAVTSKPYAVLGYASWESGLVTAGAWAAAPTRARMFVGEVPLPGAVISTARVVDAAVATGTTISPLDDTIPQNTEGDQYQSITVTPKSASNLLRVSAMLHLASSSINNFTVALFRDSGANALVAYLARNQDASDFFQTSVHYLLLAGATTSTAFKTRAGASLAGTTTYNGRSGGRLMGGVVGSYISVDEIMT